MVELHLALIAVAMAMILFGTRRFLLDVESEDGRAVLSTFFFSLWLVATAVWGPRFFTAKIPGLFDMTVERGLFILVALGFLWDILVNGRRYPTGTMAAETLMACFSAMCIISMAHYGFGSSLRNYPSPWYLFMNGYLLPFMAFAFAKCYLTRTSTITVLFHTLFYLGVYLSITAFFEFFELKQFVFPRYIEDQLIWLHLDRARGPFLNAAFNGLAINIGFICGVHLLSVKQGMRKFAYILLLSLFFPAVFFTQTRSVYLGFLITLVALACLYRTSFPKWKVLAFPTACVLTFIAFNLPRLMSADRRQGGVFQMLEVDERLALIKRSFLMFFDHPFLGVGAGRFMVASEDYKGMVQIPAVYSEITQHNHILGMLVELGVLGGILYLGIVAIFFRHLYLLADRVPESGLVGSNLLLCLAVGLIVYLNNNLFVEPTYFLFVNLVFFTFAGVSEGLYNRFSRD
ncbi:MAG: O-antigen ligase family protein [Acidobacteriota bacterium]